MKRFSLIATLALGFLGAGLAVAQTAGSKAADDHAAHHPDKGGAPSTGPAPGATPQAGKAADGMMGGGMMGGGMMGMMGGGEMMGMCPAMMSGAKFDVKKLAKGVTISITSDDSKVVARVQKMAEAMRLMHEANAR